MDEGLLEVLLFVSLIGLSAVLAGYTVQSLNMHSDAINRENLKVIATYMLDRMILSYDLASSEESKLAYYEKHPHVFSCNGRVFSVVSSNTQTLLFNKPLGIVVENNNLSIIGSYKSYNITISNTTLWSILNGNDNYWVTVTSNGVNSFSSHRIDLTIDIGYNESIGVYCIRYVVSPP